MRRQTLRLSDVEIKLDAGEGKFSGYASVFNGTDSYGDTILPGAFTSTLSEFGLPKMFLNHDSFSLPIGKWTSASEDERGLLVKGELTPGSSVAADVYASLKHQTIDGLSIGFRLKAGDYQAKDSEKPWKGYVISKVSKLVEVSVVTFPADAAARVDLGTVKSEIDSIDSVSDLEDFLREAGGFSRSAAKHFLHRSRQLLGQREADPAGDEETKSVLEEIVLRARARTLIM